MKILIPSPLRPYAAGHSAVEVPGSTVGEAVQALLTSHPELRKHLYNDQGKLRAFVNLYLNEDDVRYLQHEQTPVAETDTLSIVPSIAGGRG